MEIRKLKNLDNKSLLDYFKNTNRDDKDNFFDGEQYLIKDFQFFDPYIGSLSNDESSQKISYLFSNVSRLIETNDIPMSYLEDPMFWKSVFITEYRDELLSIYPKLNKEETVFNNVIGKRWGWENYIFKAIIVHKFTPTALNYFKTREEFYRVVSENLDVFNYLIKGPIFRNGDFITKILKIITDKDLSKLSKKKIINRPDLGLDERFGRRAIYEMNKKYPILLVHKFDINQLSDLYIKSINKYLSN